MHVRRERINCLEGFARNVIITVVRLGRESESATAHIGQRGQTGRTDVRTHAGYFSRCATPVATSISSIRSCVGIESEWTKLPPKTSESLGVYTAWSQPEGRKRVLPGLSATTKPEGRDSKSICHWYW